MSNKRVAVVSGGARGLGRAISLRLARDGHAVAVWDLKLEGAEETAAMIRAEGGSGHVRWLYHVDPGRWRRQPQGRRCADRAQLEIRSINPAGTRLPITETGYRSHFHQPGLKM